MRNYSKLLTLFVSNPPFQNDGELVTFKVSVFSASEMPISLPALFGVLSALERGGSSLLLILAKLDVIVFKGGGCPNRSHQEAA